MRIFNTLTKAVFGVPDKGSQFEYRFKRVCLGIDRKALDKSGLQRYFLTLTYGADYDFWSARQDLVRFLDKIRHIIKRADYSYFDYVWVPEFQYKRYKQYGELVLHFHIVILCDRGLLPNCSFRQDRFPHLITVNEGSLFKDGLDLFNLWGHGIVLCKYMWDNKPVYGYMSKYLTKETFVDDGNSPRKSTRARRRFGSSQLGYYAYSKWRYDAILNASMVYSDMVVFKKGSVLTIMGLDKFGSLIEVVKIKSPYIILHYPFLEGA
jgi:hypothetical protein